MTKYKNVLSKEEELKRFLVLLDSSPKKMSAKEKQFFSQEAEKLLVKNRCFKKNSDIYKD